MKDESDPINRRLGQRIHSLRSARKQSLETLAARSGVSRSMISLIERGESSPTAVVLGKLAAGLGVGMATLFDTGSDAAEAPWSPLCTHKQQCAWQDPASGYTRKNLSPPRSPSPLQLVEVTFPGGQRVHFDSRADGNRLHEQIWILEGRMQVTTGTMSYVLQSGDCLALTLDQPVMFHNPLKKPARYLVALCHAS